MKIEGKRVLVGVCSGIVMTASLGLFVLYALNDLLVTNVYFGLMHHSIVVFMFFFPLLPFMGGVWCARSAIARPYFWSKRSFTGAILLFSSLLIASLLFLPSLLIGFLGMPRRYHPAPDTLVHFFEWATLPLTLVAIGAMGTWLLWSRSRQIAHPKASA